MSLGGGADCEAGGVPGTGTSGGQVDGAGDGAVVVVEEGVGEQAHELVNAGVVFLLALVAMLLEVGVGIEIVESVDLGLAKVGVERRAVGGDGECDVALAGFNNFLGVVAAIVFFVEDEALGMVRGFGGHVIGDRAADEGCGIGGRRGIGLREGRQREQKQERGRTGERRERPACGLRFGLRLGDLAIGVTAPAEMRQGWRKWPAWRGWSRIWAVWANRALVLL